MFLWIIKQFLGLRKALTGRRNAHQLAWAIAFGFLAGLVPHGNLVAVLIIGTVLMLNLNHAMASVVGVVTALLATNLDPLTHRIGTELLNTPQFHELLSSAWQYPLVPWTDLNNSVTLGSVVLGLAALLPLFAITYPMMKLIETTDPIDEAESSTRAASADRPRLITGMTQYDAPIGPVYLAPGTSAAALHDDAIATVHRGGGTPVPSPHFPVTDDAVPAMNESYVDEQFAASTAANHAQSQGDDPDVEIDILRIADYRKADTDDQSDGRQIDGQHVADLPPMEVSPQMLSQLLRRLRAVEAAQQGVDPHQRTSSQASDTDTTVDGSNPDTSSQLPITENAA
ncbi:MAG: TIGR03546 family protein [Planctomycetota bacterium]